MNAVKCRSCGANIIWAVTERGLRIPLDAEPNPTKGNFTVEEETGPDRRYNVLRASRVAPLLDMGQVRYLAHHASCPDGKSWRRK